MNNTAKVTKETKNKIRVDFERTPFWERMRAKFINLYTVKKVVWYLFRFLLPFPQSGLPYRNRLRCR